MLAGFFPTSVTFRGSFRYASASDLEAALAAIQALIDGEDDDLATELELRRKDAELRVRVDTTCARDEYLAYETLVETLAERAIAGEVVGEIDDTITTYSAGAIRDQVASAPSHESASSARPVIDPSVVTKAGAIWIPILASDAMLAAVMS